MNKAYTPTEEDLTAYALGEADEKQTAMIEAALESQAESRALLEEIQEAVALSEAAFAELKRESLTDEQRAMVESAAESVIPMRRPATWQKLVGYAAAAGIVAAVGYGVIAPNVREQQVAYDLTPERMELIRKYELIQSGKVADELNFEQYENTPDESLQEGIAEFARKTGYERFFITDINGPGRADIVPDDYLANEITEEMIVHHHEREEHRAQDAGESVGVADGEVREVDMDSSSLITSATPESTPKPSINAQARPDDTGKAGVGGAAPEPVQRRLTPTSNEPTAAPQPSGAGPQNIVVDGSVRIRGNAFLLPQRQSTDGLSTLPEELMQITSTPEPTVVGVELQMTTPTTPSQDRFYVAGQPEDSYGLDPGFGGRPEIQSAPPVTPGTEAYDRIVENTFKRVADAPLSTFSIDVDTASYANMRRFLNQAQLPPADAVRIEELINYFNYDYPQPTGEDPFSANIEVAKTPWNPQHKLVRVGLKGKEIAVEERPATNLVFLLDVSGSMNQPNKLPLLQQSLRLLTEQLGENDRVAIAVYAGNSGLVLNSTPGNMQNQIIDALNRLQAGGSTNGGAGIQLAYDVATQNFIPGGVNRVILATDGDFNVGVTSRDDLVNLIETKAKSGVFLSVLGFGMGNLKDATMEKLADKGNGNYAYIDTFSEAKKVLADEMSGTLFTIAKDVKIQVEFNPAKVQAYRLIGYENRALADRDFNDDTKDAGEIGAGHTVTALYEIVPTGVALNTAPGVDTLRYQTPAPAEIAVERSIVNPVVENELLTVKLRYKQPEGNVSKLLEFPVQDVERDYNQASTDFKFATAVAAFGMKLRNSPFASTMTYDTVLSIAESGVGSDLNGYRAEFLGLVRQARSLSPQVTPLRYEDSTLE